jgi:hypothetical protein
MGLPTNNSSSARLTATSTPSSYPTFQQVWQEKVRDLQARKVPGDQWDAEYEALRELYRKAHPYPVTFLADYPSDQ